MFNLRIACDGTRRRDGCKAVLRRAMLVLGAIGSALIVPQDGQARRPSTLAEDTIASMPLDDRVLARARPQARASSIAVDPTQTLDDSRRGITEAADELLASGWGAWSDWSQWCEPMHAQACTTSTDCADDQECVTPSWARGERASERVCASTWPTTDERAWRRDRLRTIIDLTCSRRDGCDANRLHGFLSLVAFRESTWRPYKRHRLGVDIEAARKARERRQAAYDDNPHFHDGERWASALGMFGQNPAIFVDAWDRRAPPEILCREVEATFAYLERARRAVRGFRRRGLTPTLCDVHRAVSLGRLEKCEDDGDHFSRRARRQGLDPAGVVTEAALGQRPPREIAARLAWADAIRSALPGKPAPR